MQGTGTAERPAARGCAHHPDRRPVGVCRICGSPVCSECLTRLDGILHCRDCLATKARELGTVRRSAWGRAGTTLAVLVVLPPVLAALAGALELAGIVAGRASRLAAVTFETTETTETKDK